MESIRKRPGKYIGDTESGGLHHLFKEIIDNSIDEVLAGYCTEIDVIYRPGYSLSVEDNGRGIPIGFNEDTGKDFVEFILTELHAGRRFRAASHISHGVGASVVNALSQCLECEVRSGGKIYRQRFERGKPTNPLAIVGECPPSNSGTKITWLADDTVFKTIQYNPDLLRQRIRELAYLYKEVSISFHDQQNGTPPETYHYERGIADYIAFLNSRKETLHPDVIYIVDAADDIQIEIALQYTAETDETVLSHVNHIYTRENGTPVRTRKRFSRDAPFRRYSTKRVDRYRFTTDAQPIF